MRKNTITEQAQNRKDMLADDYVWRYRGVKLLIVFVVLIVCFRLGYLQVINRHFLQNQGDQRSVRLIKIPAHRGIIFDRNGKALAVSTPVMTVWVNPKELLNTKNKLAELALLLGTNEQSLVKRLKDNEHLDFLYLKRQLAPGETKKIMALKIPGVHSIREYKRYYPSGPLVAQIIGMTNIDNQGQSGIELTYNKWLAGHRGKERIIRDLYGHAIDKAEIVKSSEPGKPIYLSIDLRLQYLAYQALAQTVEKHQASSGSIVMVNPSNGEVLAMVNIPSFNPNNRKHYIAEDARNRAVTDQYEPGSTIKALTVTAALASGKFTPTTPIDTTPGRMIINGYTVKDDRNLGKLDVTGVITRSSNIGATKMAFAIGQRALTHVLRAFGLGSPTGVTFPGEAFGMVPSAKRLSQIGLSNLAFGYHISVTPLQLVRAYAAIANGGVLHDVSLLKLNQQPEGHRVVSQKIADEVVDMLETVVDKGTGRKAKIAGYSVGGKTGTSHRASAEGYKKDSYYSSFIGFVPLHKPKLVMLVMLNDVKKGSYFGGTVAGPVFAKVASEALRIMGVSPDRK